MELVIFRCLIAAHIAAGGTAAIAFWVPVIGRKGSVNHRKWGRIFTRAVLLTGCFAVAMSLLTLADPLTVHPHLVGQFDVTFLRGVFGWMMLHNAILTVTLGSYGRQVVTNRRNLAANRTPLNIGLQYCLMVAAVVCAWKGSQIGHPLMTVLMMGVAFVGFAAATTNLMFIFSRNPSSVKWLKEHVKALIGTGISVYTAFFAFGAVRLMPALALHPGLWAIPLVTGLTIMLYHNLRIDQKAGLGLFALTRRRGMAASD
jgi:hypothetical protein